MNINKLIYLPKKKYVVYILYNNNKEIYIGISKNIFLRITDHLRDKRKKFDSFSILLETDTELDARYCEKRLIKIYEKTIINVSRPQISPYDDMDIQYPISKEQFNLLQNLNMLEKIKLIQNLIDNRGSKTIDRVLKENNFSRNVYYAHKDILNTKKTIRKNQKITDEILEYIKNNLGRTGKDLNLDILREFNVKFSNATIIKYKRKLKEKRKIKEEMNRSNKEPIPLKSFL